MRDDVVIERRYVNCRYGQIHIHVARPLNPADQTQNPILCLHPSPASGWYYRDLITDLGKDRIAMAVDTPGYRGSDFPHPSQTWRDTRARWLTHLRVWATD
ncbi:MAG: alpha/beta fold hydrolase [Rhodospirillaceae bacterium]